MALASSVARLDTISVPQPAARRRRGEGDKIAETTLRAMPAAPESRRSREIRFNLAKFVSNSRNPFQTRQIRFKLAKSVSNLPNPFQTRQIRFKLARSVSNSRNPSQIRQVHSHLARFVRIARGSVRSREVCSQLAASVSPRTRFVTPAPIFHET
jgi:hypothetical protein